MNETARLELDQLGRQWQLEDVTNEGIIMIALASLLIETGSADKMLICELMRRAGRTLRDPGSIR